jgi:Holliday junction resolvase RusA-like endonuclease
VIGGVIFPGTPVQQGSKKAYARTRKSDGKVFVNVVDDNKKELKSWRRNALDELAAVHPGISHAVPVFARYEPVALRVLLVFPLRLSDKRAAATGETIWHTTTPDADKVLRAVCDVLTAGGVWHDDNQLCSLELRAVRGVDPRVDIQWAPLDGAHWQC